MDIKTTSAHNASLTGAVDIQSSELPTTNMFRIMSQEAARIFIRQFKQNNPDIQLSDSQWTKLIDALIQ